jgi:hypothetical protein
MIIGLVLIVIQDEFASLSFEVILNGEIEMICG